jgi:hypothetical protein
MAGLSDLPVAIVGAGPFGLSVVAHLRSAGVPFRIFGPMHRWRAQMPIGMFLKSEWDASSLADPAGRYTPTILRRGGATLRNCSDSARHVYRICAVLSAASGPQWLRMSWWLRERVLGRVPILLGQSLLGAATRGEKAIVHVIGADGRSRDLAADYIVAATGYRFAASSLPFLSASLLRDLRCVEQVPLLSPSFESSIPGLYFTGVASAYNFGPVMRFVCGSQYMAERICRHIVRKQVPSRSAFVALASERNANTS